MSRAALPQHTGQRLQFGRHPGLPEVPRGGRAPARPDLHRRCAQRRRGGAEAWPCLHARHSRFLLHSRITIPGMKPAPDALMAVYTAPPGAMAALLVVAGCVESSSTGGKLTMLDMFKDTDREPGDLNSGKQFLLGKWWP